MGKHWSSIEKEELMHFAQASDEENSEDFFSYISTMMLENNYIRTPSQCRAMYYKLCNLKTIKDRILLETPDEVKQKVREYANNMLNNPKFYSSNTDSYYTPEESGWYVQYKTESGDSEAVRVSRKPVDNEDALNLLKELNPDEIYYVQFYNEINK